MSQRHVFALDLIDDAELIAAYEELHAPGAVWPEVISDIRQRGFIDMEIWRIDDRLVMIAEVADDFPRPTTPELAAAVRRWEREMDRFQRPLRADREKWSPMRRIFSLGDGIDDD